MRVAVLVLFIVNFYFASLSRAADARRPSTVNSQEASSPSKVPKTAVIDPDPEVQQQIAAFAAVPAREKLERYRQALAVLALAGRDQTKAILNIGFYAAHAPPNPNLQSSLETFYELKGLLELPTASILSTLVPLLYKGDDQLDRLILEDIVAMRGGLWWSIPTLSDFESYVSEHPDNAPPSMLDQMFARDPEKALVALGRVYKLDHPEYREFLWTGHLVSDVDWKYDTDFLKSGELQSAVAALERLARSNEWWVRLYVAHILSRDEEFRQPALCKRLSEDGNHFVRQAMARVPTLSPSGTTTGESESKQNRGKIRER